MKTKLSILLAVLLTAAIFCGCAKTTKTATADEPSPTVETAAIETVKATGPATEPAPTEAPTVPEATDPPATEAPTQAPKTEYYAVDLIKKSLSEIKEIMGGEYRSERLQLSNAFSSDGCSYIYNNDILPGFAFADGGDDYYGISIMNGAKLNSSISSDMNYNQIADVIGDMEGMMVAQAYNIACSATVDGYSVTFCFIENSYINQNRGKEGIVSSDVLRAGNPELQSIGIHKIQ